MREKWISTAHEIRVEFRQKGRDPASATPADLEKVYRAHAKARLERSFEPPDFTGGAALLPNDAVDPYPDPVVGLLIETRQHPNLVTVVSEIVVKLGLRVQIFHGTGNRDFVKSSPLAPMIADGRIVLTELATDALEEPLLNGMMQLPRFWELVIGRGHILSFQTDAIVCDRSPYNLEDFMEFDYIGPPFWQDHTSVAEEDKIDGLRLNGGCGGLALRTWNKTWECLERFPPEAFNGAEDTYFAFHLDIIGRVGRFHDCAKFGSQRRFFYKSFGAHQLTLMNRIDLGFFLDYCPEAKRIAGDARPIRAVSARIRRRFWQFRLKLRKALIAPDENWPF